MTIKVREKKNPRILPYGFAMDMGYANNEEKNDVLPIILYWIFENIGIYDKERWQVRTHMGDRKFLSVYFRDPVDAMAFKLEWS